MRYYLNVQFRGQRFKPDCNSAVMKVKVSGVVQRVDWYHFTNTYGVISHKTNILASFSIIFYFLPLFHLCAFLVCFLAFIISFRHFVYDRFTQWCSWLRHCAKDWKVAGSIPDSVIVICLWNNPPDRIMALGSTQPLTEMSTRNISLGINAAGLKISKPQSPETLWICKRLCTGVVISP